MPAEAGAAAAPRSATAPAAAARPVAAPAAGPAKSQERPANLQERAAKSKERPAKLQERAPKAQQRPAKPQEGSARSQERSAKLQEHPAKSQERSAKLQERVGAFVTDRDIAPLFSSGPLAAARADFEAERWAAAAKKLSGRKEPEARWLAALALALDGRHAEALPLLDGLATKLPAIADRIQLRLGQALDAAGRRREAADVYAKVTPESLQYSLAVLGRARALDALGESDDAVVALLPLLALKAPAGSPPAAVAEALLLAGRIRARGGDADFARHAWVECWAAYPLTSESKDCSAALATLPAPANAQPDVESRVRRAEEILDANRNRAAMAELDPVLAMLPPPGPSEPLACRAHFVYGKALRRERQHSKSMAQLAPVVDRCTDPDLRVRALYVLASATSIAVPEEGLPRYLQLAREYPHHPFADDALFYAADLHGFAGRLEDARALLLSLADRYPRGDFRAEALFRVAWLSNKLGDRDGAIVAFTRVEDEYADDPYESARAGYWRARLLEERGRPGDLDLAAGTWAGIAERYPADYYGLLATARLTDHQLAPVAAGPHEKARPAVKHAAPKPKRVGEFRYASGPLAKDPHLAAGMLLLRIGLADAAAQELAAVDRSSLSVEEPDPLLLLAELLDRAGDHRNAHMLVRTVGKVALRGRPDGGTERIWRIAYPPAYRTEVTRWAPKSGLEPDLLQAIMREESALDPKVISAAGAIGLTQLMIPTAQDSATKLKLRGKITAADLMNPATNIRLGAHHLGSLVKRFRGSAPLAIAAYNVGEAPVRRWVRERGTLPLDAFVEEIPVQETRGYVKRVLRSYAAYHLLLGGVPGDALALRQTLPQLE
ncbi:MAG TPA: transglycosylase SLT domain-containing protein [Anaeromyxobacteraceae bacterium]|nr:transglycosylase SLT domain-containing protein [Anaeromyxobacteraceae bacterium]